MYYARPFTDLAANAVQAMLVLVRCRAESFNTTTVAHEVGHYFGIWQGGQHNPDIGSLMFEYGSPKRGTKLDWTDVQQLLKISKPKR